MSAWITGNKYLNISEMENNAKIIKDYFVGFGYTINSICAIIGNMQTESTINPHIWEGLTVDYNKGYGLTQWTPATKYIEWAGDTWENPDRELDRIQWEITNNEQWFRNINAPIIDPPFSFIEFMQSDLSPEILANYFLWYYEHPAEINQPIRGEQALYWYNYFDSDPDPPKPTPPVPKVNYKKMKLILYGRLWQ